jgi:anion-transporting  ArsA/GET3 family ATPase
VLLAQVNARDRVSGLYEVPPIGDTIRSVSAGIDAVNLNPAAALEEFGRMTLRFGPLYRAVFENRTVRAFLSAVPGLDAWAMLGKATYHALQKGPDGRYRYDTVVLDAPATGHAISLLGVPRAVAAAAPPGPLRRDALERAELLEDPERAEVLPVTLLEEMPVTETAELVGRVREELRMSVRSVAANEVIPARFDAEELGDLANGDPLPGCAPALLEAARFDLRRRALQQEQRRRLRRLLDMPTVELPRIPERRLRRTAVESLAERLAPLL